ncbi:MAG: hypothetical protein HXS51_01775 [Theionarchaea archaeon]|nr:hypothetical protein [Theionarchaea archaeon]MBU6999468.1 hypothetical protein [Theionarchaea archaeon]
MEYMTVKRWHEYNRSERIKDLMAALGYFGQGEAEYLRGRPFLLRTLLGEGCPNPVDESEKWNQVAITYQGKDVIHIFDSAFGAEGEFLEEPLTEAEAQKARDVLAANDFVLGSVWKSRIKWTRLVFVLSALVGVISTFSGFLAGDLIAFVLSLAYTVCLFLILLMA